MRLGSSRWLAPSLPVLAGSALLLAGCSGAARDETPQPPPNPPPPYVEALPLQPISEDPLVWQPGHWDWTGVGYTWREGRWVPKAGHGTQWQAGYWTRGDEGAWHWVPAHWL